MRDFLKHRIDGKKILILGFGREGRSTFKLLKTYFPELSLAIADSRDDLEIPETSDPPELILGSGYLDQLKEFDLVFKAPGIPTEKLNNLPLYKITSQTDVFLEYYSRQIIGVTGTKGKSTTSSLIYHITSLFNANSLLLGNIGVPPFDDAERINNESLVVCELSSHQLEYITKGPHIGVLLNIYQEHLDHHGTFEAYSNAKFNIVLKQTPEDYLVYNADNPVIERLIQTSNLKRKYCGFTLNNNPEECCYYHNGNIYFKDEAGKVSMLNISGIGSLMGEHNIRNVMAAVCACKLSGVPDEFIIKGIASFKPLEHRLECVGEYNGITYYNDSIATIPEATIEALKAIGNVDTLILGGYDRGIDYSGLVDFIATSGIKNIILLGKVGGRIYAELTKKSSSDAGIFPACSLEDAVNIAKNKTQKPGICLLSPAAASYDSFKNFEERGMVYKKLVRDETTSH